MSLKFIKFMSKIANYAMVGYEIGETIHEDFSPVAPSAPVVDVEITNIKFILFVVIIFVLLVGIFSIGLKLYSTMRKKKGKQNTNARSNVREPRTW